MAIRIGSNITSLQVQRNLANISANLSNGFERLSSGLRINRASDDAAGLAVSESLKANSRVYNQAMRNLSDGVSYLNIADSSMSAISDIVTRGVELAEQSSNGTYSDTQRKAMQSEADALAAEYNRIINTIEYNGRKILSSTSSENQLRLQCGYGVDGSLAFSLGDQLAYSSPSGTFGAAIAYSISFPLSRGIELADLNGDGALDMVETGTVHDVLGPGEVSVRMNNGDGTYSSATIYTVEAIDSNALSLADVNGDGSLDVITAGFDSDSGKATVRLNNGHGSFLAATTYTTDGSRSNALCMVDINNDGALDMVTAGQTTSSGPGSITIRLNKNDGSGTFAASVSFTGDPHESFAIAGGDLNGDQKTDLVVTGWLGEVIVMLNDGNGNFNTRANYSGNHQSSYALELKDMNSDGKLDIVSCGKENATGHLSVLLNQGNGTFGSRLSYTAAGGKTEALRVGDVNGDGSPDVISAGYGDSRAWVRLNNGHGSLGEVSYFELGQSYSLGLALGDVNKDGVVDLVSTGKTVAGYNKATVLLGLSESLSALLPSIDVSTQVAARASLDSLGNRQKHISAERGAIGSYQSRLSVALTNLFATRENIDASASRITDVDVAQEAANVVKSQITQQVASTVLAQANQSPHIALQLLGQMG